jgi:hypothetical protein
MPTVVATVTPSSKVGHEHMRHQALDAKAVITIPAVFVGDDRPARPATSFFFLAHRSLHPVDAIRAEQDPRPIDIFPIGLLGFLTHAFCRPSIRGLLAALTWTLFGFGSSHHSILRFRLCCFNSSSVKTPSEYRAPCMKPSQRMALFSLPESGHRSCSPVIVSSSQSLSFIIRQY